MKTERVLKSQLQHILFYVLSCFSHVPLFVILRTVACQTPLSTGFSRQEYWSGLSCPPPGDLPDPGIKPMIPTSPALTGGVLYHQRHLGHIPKSDSSQPVTISSWKWTIIFFVSPKPYIFSIPYIAKISYLVKLIGPWKSNLVVHSRKPPKLTFCPCQ